MCADPGAGRSGGAGRNGPEAANCLVAVRLHTRNRIGAGGGAALRGKHSVSVAVRRDNGESSFVVRLSHRSWKGLGQFIHAGDCVVGREGVGEGESDQPGWSAGTGGSGSRKFSAGRALAQAAGGSPATRGGVTAATGSAGTDGGGQGQEGESAEAASGGEAKTAGAGHGAVTGVEEETRGSRPDGGPGQVWGQDSEQGTAGEHDRPGSAGAEDAEWGI